MLTHPFPRVRTYVAEQMYTYLMENNNVENHSGSDNHRASGNNGKNDIIQNLLLNTLWTNDFDGVLVLLRSVAIQISIEFGIDMEFQNEGLLLSVPKK